MQTKGTYFDGQTAKSHEVEIKDEAGQLRFAGPTILPTSWTIAGLHAIDDPAAGQPFRLTHGSSPGERLVVQDGIFINHLTSSHKHLKGGYTARDIKQLVGWTLAGIAAFAALMWLAFIVLPGPIAKLMPEKWRERTGNEMEASLTEGYKRCTGPAVEKAFGQILGNFAEGTSDIPSVSVRIYDLPIVNAFAVTGGHIIFTRQLIAKADGPDEVAGVLAHEMGHVALLHPEKQMVQLIGINFISSIFGGGSNPAKDALLVAGLLRSSRSAESQSDEYARKLLEGGRIDTKGLKSFFEKIQKLEGTPTKSNAALETLGNIFATHPGTEERIKNIAPLPAGVVARPSMDAQTWEQLKAACG